MNMLIAVLIVALVTISFTVYEILVREGGNFALASILKMTVASVWIWFIYKCRLAILGEKPNYPDEVLALFQGTYKNYRYTENNGCYYIEGQRKIDDEWQAITGNELVNKATAQRHVSYLSRTINAHSTT